MVPYLFLADVALLVTLALSALLYNAGSSPNKSLPHYYRWIRHRHPGPTSSERSFRRESGPLETPVRVCEPIRLDAAGEPEFSCQISRFRAFPRPSDRAGAR